MIWFQLGIMGVIMTIVGCFFFIFGLSSFSATEKRTLDQERSDAVIEKIILGTVVVTVLGILLALSFFPLNYECKYVTRYQHGWSFGGRYIADSQVQGVALSDPKKMIFRRAGLFIYIVTNKPPEPIKDHFIEIVDKVGTAKLVVRYKGKNHLVDNNRKTETIHLPPDCWMLASERFVIHPSQSWAFTISENQLDQDIKNGHLVTWVAN